ncbi:hypothetical protein AZE42_09231 [Rhizopogon vesiculosus]|uniref:Uncharacterized protein n=1 Tax=Rhizopogon vesiculosus TaxID=180088 RepID=A0A1J8PZU0_9AGAM|nr:hypothetical protein AZE42_09231 [Rhizopogon vesiculosus]
MGRRPKRRVGEWNQQQEEDKKSKLQEATRGKEEETQDERFH